jgi:hypothetical protein
MENILHNPVELFDEDLDVVAGGNGLGLSIDVNVNVAAIDQLILQIQVGGVANSEAAANVASVSQSA